MLFFNHQLIWKHFYLRIYFIYNYSILNIELHIKKWNWGFNIGEIIDSSLLNSLLLSWDGILNRKISCQNVINIISPLFYQNMKSNPWYKKYIIIFEQSNEFNNMCILYFIIKCCWWNYKKNNRFNNGFESMHVTDEIQNLSLLFYLHYNS